MSAAVPTSPARPVARRLGRRRCGVLAGVGTLLPLLIAGCAGPVAAPAHAVPTHAVPIDAALVTRPGVGPAAPVAPPPGAKQGQALPPGVPVPPAGTDQLVTVLVPAATSTSGILRGWQRAAGGGWNSVLGPVRVRVGTDGVGTAREGVNRTPRGTFTLSQAFGRQPNPGTALPYRRVGASDWWVSDTKSPAYNTFRTCEPGTCSFDEGAGENLGRAGASYDYAMVIGYNTAPVRPGAGSAFFVHVDAGAPSQGCVEVPRASVLSLIRWLAPAHKPLITIGLG
ncbi:L,D-transpeptidase family protein [Pseudonocardia sp. Cha107L01]|uniref:L,D-transpeptidase family protein n=1 Tax=Pseudonocardia sp. Cha107L01 TaxID=3457576 RepID=UPI00403ED5E2